MSPADWRQLCLRAVREAPGEATREATRGAPPGRRRTPRDGDERSGPVRHLEGVEVYPLPDGWVAIRRRAEGAP